MTENTIRLVRVVHIMIWFDENPLGHPQSHYDLRDHPYDSTYTQRQTSVVPILPMGPRGRAEGIRFICFIYISSSHLYNFLLKDL